eukprot:15368862-Alexandrium_andersonii.AAC.1
MCDCPLGAALASGTCAAGSMTARWVRRSPRAPVQRASVRRASIFVCLRAAPGAACVFTSSCSGMGA